MPRWLKIAAVVVAVVLVAVGNTAAKQRQRSAERAAADRVDVTMVTTGGNAGDKTFALAVLVGNRGKAPITLKAGRHVLPPSYDASLAVDRVVAGGATEQIELQFRARCPVTTAMPAGQTQLVLSAAPSSGRVRDVTATVDELRLWDLSRQACGYLPLEDSIVPFVRSVSSTKYNVLFTLDVHNQSTRRVVLANVTSPGLAIAVRGGVPVLLAPGSATTLPMSAALPACSRVPAFAPPGRGGALRFGTLALELRDASGASITWPYTLGADGDGLDLLTQLFALRTRICPGAGTPTGTGRPRFS